MRFEDLDPRLRRAAERVEAREAVQVPAGSRSAIVTNDAARLIFAGTDLPAEQVQHLVSSQTWTLLREIADGEQDEVEPMVAGALVAVFLLGYFAREEVERA